MSRYKVKIYFYLDFATNPTVEDNENDNPDGVQGSMESNAVGPTRRKHRRRVLTYQRAVNSIDTALDEKNYTPMETYLTVQKFMEFERNLWVCIRNSNNAVSLLEDL